MLLLKKRLIFAVTGKACVPSVHDSQMFGALYF